MAKLKLACVQMDVEIGNVAANLNKIIGQIKAAAAASAQLVIFPEMALTGYCFESLEEVSQYAEPLDGPSADAIQKVCGETGAYAIVGFIERDGSGLYNAAMVVGPEGVIGSYRKVHMPFIGADRFLTPGDRPFAIFDLPIGKVAINICYDTSFPEAARTLKLLGAELIVLPTNWPTGARRTAEFVINTRAIENHVHYVAVNRVGVERGWRFIGKSLIADCNGDTVAKGSGEAEEILFAELDLAESNQNHIVNVPGQYELDRLRDRRPEFYRVIAEPVSKAHTAD